jgi:hypothetical protein
MRPFWAFLIAPIPAAALMPMIDASEFAIHAPVAAFVLFYVLFLAMQTVFGLPLRWLLLRGGRSPLAVHIVAGTMMTALPTSIYGVWAILGAGRSTLAQIATAVMMLAAMGAVTGVVQWLFTTLDTPEKRHRREMADLRTRFD